MDGGGRGYLLERRGRRGGSEGVSEQVSGGRAAL